MSALKNSKYQVGLIGVGNMGEALLAALVSANFPKNQLYFAEKREERATEITQEYGAKALDLTKLVSSCDVLLLVVKPQDLGALLAEIGSSIKAGTILISFVAGKKISFIADLVGSDIKIIRVMPNTPMLIGEGMSAYSAGNGIGAAEVNFLDEFLGSSGKVISVEEELQDAVTALSGSGPAYFFAFAEEMIKGGVSLGLHEEDATILTVQTMLGAAVMLDESGLSATKLRENVTSPNGTTAAALAKFSEGNLGELIKSAMVAARDRSQELA